MGISRVMQFLFEIRSLRCQHLKEILTSWPYNNPFRTARRHFVASVGTSLIGKYKVKFPRDAIQICDETKSVRELSGRTKASVEKLLERLLSHEVCLTNGLVLNDLSAELSSLLKSSDALQTNDTVSLIRTKHLIGRNLR